MDFSLPPDSDPKHVELSSELSSDRKLTDISERQYGLQELTVLVSVLPNVTKIRFICQTPSTLDFYPQLNLLNFRNKSWEKSLRNQRKI